MAQSGYTQIQLYSSPTPGNTPAASNLTGGELAVNAADGKLFYKNTAGTTQVIADSAWAAYSSGVAVQGSGTSIVGTGTVQFANSNGVTFGLNGNTMTASVAAQSVASYNILSAAGNTAGTLTSFSSGTVILAGGNNVTLSQNSNTISINAAANLSISAGTTSTATASVVFANSNNIQFGLTSNTVTAGAMLRSYDPTAYFDVTSTVSLRNVSTLTATNATSFTNSFVLYPIVLESSLSFNRIEKTAAWTGLSNISANFLSSVTSDSTKCAFTQTAAYVNAFYTKTGDTFSRYTQVSYSLGYSIQASFSSATTVGGSRWYGHLTATVNYPVGYSSNGLVIYSSGTTSSINSTRTSTAQFTSNLGITVPRPFSGGFATTDNTPGLTITQQFPLGNSTPVTLPPNTYWVMDGMFFGQSNAATSSAFVGVNLFDTAMTVSIGDLRQIALSNSTNPGLNIALAAFGNVASATDYNALQPGQLPWYWSITTDGVGTTTYWSGTGGWLYSTSGFPAASYLSTVFGRSQTVNAFTNRPNMSVGLGKYL